MVRKFGTAMAAAGDAAGEGIAIRSAEHAPAQKGPAALHADGGVGHARHPLVMGNRKLVLGMNLFKLDEISGCYLASSRTTDI